MTTALTQVAEWNISRNLTHYNDLTEVNNILKEVTELADAGKADDDHERIDALCDIIVFAAGAIHKLGYQPELALLETVKEISSRKGSINPITGKWEKDPSQHPSTLHKASYSSCTYSQR